MDVRTLRGSPEEHDDAGDGAAAVGGFQQSSYSEAPRRDRLLW